MPVQDYKGENAHAERPVTQQTAGEKWDRRKNHRKDHVSSIMRETVRRYEANAEFAEAARLG